MADLKITQLNEVIAPVITDLLPIVNASETKRVTVANLSESLPLTTFVRNVSTAWGGAPLPAPAVRFVINGSSGLFNTNNNVEYIVPFNTRVFQTDGSVLSGDIPSDNIIIRQPGFYLIDCRYASYDLFYAGAASQGTLRVRLYASPVLITSVGIGTLIHQVGAGAVTTGTWNVNPAFVVDNGFAERSGCYTLRVETVPIYLAMTFIHTGGTANGNTQAYPVLNDANGTQPYMQVTRIST